MKKSWQIFWHVFFWLSIISVFLLLAQGEMRLGPEGIFVTFFLYPAINIGLFYLNYLVYIPRFLDKKKYTAYAIIIVITLILFGLGKYGIGLLFKPYVLVRMHETIGFWQYFISTIFASLTFVFLSTVLKFTTDWFLNERIQRDLENQRLSAELSFLKSQINPHFLFNSLNSIYSLAYQRSETTPDAILKLSEIMRYMLYECNDNEVSLKKELQYLQNYIELQKIRFGKKAYIDFKINGKVDGQQIVPLLLIAFIENAFKHGDANAKDWLTLKFLTTSTHITFSCTNKKTQKNKDREGGIGIENIRRRLELLYPSQHQLHVNEDQALFTVKLTLNYGK